MSKFKILLIEDDPWDVKIFQRIMKTEHEAFDMIFAKRLSEALEILQVEKVDLILLDLGLPDSQGLETLEPVLKQVKNTPIIVVTGSDNEELPLKALEMGAHDYLIKEMIDNHSLKRAIRYTIERHILIAEIERKDTSLKITENRFKKYIEDNFISSLVIDANGIVRFVNHAAERLFGRGEGEMIGSMFNYRMADQEMKRVSISNKSGTSIPVDMFVQETVWDEDKAYVASFINVKK